MNPDSTPPAATLRARLALDLRSLAALRAGLSLYLLYDALLRLAHAGLLYADSGVLPRAFAVDAMDAAAWSLHLANGSVAFALAMGLLQAAAATALLIGWRARWIAPLLWLLCSSALARHPAAVTAADALALTLLTFGLFLPWQARWSLDAARSETRGSQAPHASWAGVLLLVQVAALPALLGLPDRLLASVQTLASMDALPVAVGTLLHAAAWLIVPLALLPLAQPAARRVALALSLLLCASALFTSAPGALVWLALAGTALLIDRALWDRAASRLPALRVYHGADDTGARALARLLRELLCLRAEVLPAQDSARVARLFAADTRLVLIDANEQAHVDRDAVALLLQGSPLLRPLRGLLRGGLGATLATRLLGTAAERAPTTPSLPTCTLGPTLRPVTLHTVLALLLGAGLALQQLAAIGLLPRVASGASQALLAPLGLGLGWIPRLPPVSADTTWVVAIGEIEDGREVDALSEHLSAPRFDVPASALFTGARARSYAQQIAGADAAPARLALAHYLCARHRGALLRLRLALLVHDPDSATQEQRVLLRHACGNGS